MITPLVLPQRNLSSSRTEQNNRNFIAIRPSRVTSKDLKTTEKNRTACLFGSLFKGNGKVQRTKAQKLDRKDAEFLPKFALPITVIGGLLATTARSDMKFDQLNDKFEKRFDQIDQRFAQADTQSALMNSKLIVIDQKLEKFEVSNDKRFEKLEKNIEVITQEAKGTKKFISRELINELRGKVGGYERNQNMLDTSQKTAQQVA